MPRRQAIPRLWLMTDERIGDALWDAIAALPPGSGIVFRHYATPLLERRRLFAAISTIARRRKLLLIRAGRDRLARREDGVHGRAQSHSGVRTWSAHSRREALAGIRAGADVLFVSPMFATHSHPGAGALGPHRAASIIRGLPAVAIALGGMDARRHRALARLGFYGWAGIDAWVGPGRADQKRKAVPI